MLFNNLEKCEILEIAGSFSIVALPLLSLSHRRLEDRVAKDRQWFSIEFISKRFER